MLIISSLEAQSMKNGQATLLSECPSSPNCVSSLARQDDATHYAPPLPFRGDAAESMKRIDSIVRAMPRVRIVRSDAQRLEAVFTSRLFRFKDDVVFAVDAERRLVHFRSASRTGYSDMGVNRKRIEEIRRAYLAD
jgi:uncharacterized protein (DUF1499 family)